MSLNMSQDQIAALNGLLSGESTFITGGAGVGKSTLMGQFDSQKKGTLAKLATTGAAASIIRGQTFHSFFGIAPRIHIPGSILDGRADVNLKAVKKAFSFDAIMIDEVSMLRIDMLQAMMEVLELGRRTSGKKKKKMQLIAVGDFAQLPPVVTKEEREVLMHSYGGALYAFEHQGWERLTPRVLTMIHRQGGDKAFAKWLTDLRTGNEPDLDFINQNVKPKEADSVHLVARNDKARKINSEKMDELKTKAIVNRGVVTGNFNDKNMRIPQEQMLKIGARVIICANDKLKRYHNGSTGTLTDFGRDKDGEYNVVLLDKGTTVRVRKFSWETVNYVMKNDTYAPQVVAAYKQMPLLPGWAITIHRAQGMSLDKVHVDLSGIFEKGQAYVALSRATSLQGLTLEVPMKDNDIIIDPKVLHYNNKIFKTHDDEMDLENLF